MSEKCLVHVVKEGKTSIPIKNSSSKCTSFTVSPRTEHPSLAEKKPWAHTQHAPWPCSSSLSYFTFGGGAGGRVGGGGCVSACCGLFAPGCRFGDNCGGEGVEACGVTDVTHLVLGLKHERCHACVQSFRNKGWFKGALPAGCSKGHSSWRQLQTHTFTPHNSSRWKTWSWFVFIIVTAHLVLAPGVHPVLPMAIKATGTSDSGGNG